MELQYFLYIFKSVILQKQRMAKPKVLKNHYSLPQTKQHSKYFLLFHFKSIHFLPIFTFATIETFIIGYKLP